ncbi:hypothetical protein BJX66DRAFT_349676 [Aspergillus keveii]|uniref:DUF221 domain protein n=1 Tax=Aspergillus keveii TaxID=714993 RepID=A0ABR4FJ28_9EURO
MNSTILDSALADAAGKAQKSQGLSAESFFISLAVYGTILLCSFTIFTFCKDHRLAAFQPRCLKDKTIEFLPRGRITWVRHLVQLVLDEEFLVQKLGLDGYLALRLLKTAIIMLTPAMVLTLPVLVPVYLTAGKGGVAGFDKLSISNIQADQTNRFWIVTLVTIILDIHFCRILNIEFQKVLRLRQAFLHDHSQAPMLLLITEIPPRMWNDKLLSKILSSFTSGPVEIILPRRNECEYKQKRVRELLDELHTMSHTSSQSKKSTFLPAAIQNVNLPSKHELSIRWQVRRLTRDIKDITSVAIVCFPELFSAHLALQARAVSVPRTMECHSIEDSVLKSLTGVYRTRLSRSLTSLGLLFILTVLAVFWAIPIALTGLLSQLKYLETITSHLDGLSNAQLSTIQGILPQIALSLLIHYFIFLYTQSFLVVSISSSVTTMIPEIISDFQSIPAILATNLPKASNYFYPYMLLQAVSHSIMVLFQLPESLFKIVRGPRNGAPEITEWSFVYGVFTNLISICIVFSVISPVLLVVGLAMFVVFLVVYSYQAIYVLDGHSQSPGLLYWEALHHIFVGIYTKDLFLFGIFTLRNSVGPMIVVVFLIGAVAWTQNYVQRNFRPLVKYISATQI